MVEAGGVEPPSLTRCSPTSTCFSDFANPPQTRKLRLRARVTRVATTGPTFARLPHLPAVSVRPCPAGVNRRTVWHSGQSFGDFLNRKEGIRVVLDGFGFREQGVDVHISFNSICVVTGVFTRPTVILGMSRESMASNRNQCAPFKEQNRTSNALNGVIPKITVKHSARKSGAGSVRH